MDALSDLLSRDLKKRPCSEFDQFDIEAPVSVTTCTLFHQRLWVRALWAPKSQWTNSLSRATLPIAFLSEAIGPRGFRRSEPLPAIRLPRPSMPRGLDSGDLLFSIFQPRDSLLLLFPLFDQNREILTSESAPLISVASKVGATSRSSSRPSLPSSRSKRRRQSASPKLNQRAAARRSSTAGGGAAAPLKRDRLAGFCAERRGLVKQWMLLTLGALCACLCALVSTSTSAAIISYTVTGQLSQEFDFIGVDLDNADYSAQYIFDTTATPTITDFNSTRTIAIYDPMFIAASITNRPNGAADFVVSSFTVEGGTRNELPHSNPVSEGFFFDSTGAGSSPLGPITFPDIFVFGNDLSFYPGAQPGPMPEILPPGALLHVEEFVAASPIVEFKYRLDNASIVLSAVPEPGTGLLQLTAMLVVAGLSRRRVRSGLFGFAQAA